MRQSHPLRQLMQGDHSKLEREQKRLLRNASRIVVKVGTSTVTAPDGTLRRDYVEPLVSSIARLHAAGKQVVLVSSGAIGLGRGWVGLHRSRLDDLVTKQARSEEHTSELQSLTNLVCRLLLEKKKKKQSSSPIHKKKKTEDN